MKKIKSRSNYILLFILIAPFLAMQWTTTHIHLGEHHHHDGSFHQHKIKAHVHHLTEQCVAASDFCHQANHTNVLEFDQEYNLQKRGNQKNLPIAIVTCVVKSPTLFLPISVPIHCIINARLSHLDRSTINLRAPPQTS